jgi:hypothetical protein
MNYVLGGILAIAGAAVLIWNKSLSERWRTFNAGQVNAGFGRFASFMGWSDPNRPFIVFLYRSLTILLGLFLWLMAFHSFFGTIYTGSAAQPTAPMLQEQQ